MTDLKDKLTKLAMIQSLELTPLKKTAVNTQTQEEYNELLRVYEIGGWRGGGGALPTSCLGHWQKYKKVTCFIAGVDRLERKVKFGYGDKSFYLKKNWDVISEREFCKTQKITPEILKKINEYFGERK